jgi:hypothetical protein
MRLAFEVNVQAALVLDFAAPVIREPFRILRKTLFGSRVAGSKGNTEWIW